MLNDLYDDSVKMLILKRSRESFPELEIEEGKLEILEDNQEKKEGGFGEVNFGTYKDGHHNFAVAIKIPSCDLDNIQEAYTCNSISHPCFEKLIGWYIKDRKFCIVYERAMMNFLEYLQKDQIDPKVIYLTLFGTAKGLSYIHSLPKQIIHKDIKPMNILLIDTKLNSHDYKVPLICDMGPSGGTPDYYPENEENITPKYDVYSFGKVIEKNIMHVIEKDEWKKELKKIMDECVKEDPNRRISMAEVVDKLTRLIEDKYNSDSDFLLAFHEYNDFIDQYAKSGTGTDVIEEITKIKYGASYKNAFLKSSPAHIQSLAYAHEYGTEIDKDLYEALFLFSTMSNSYKDVERVAGKIGLKYPASEASYNEIVERLNKVLIREKFNKCFDPRLQLSLYSDMIKMIDDTESKGISDELESKKLVSDIKEEMENIVKEYVVQALYCLRRRAKAGELMACRRYGIYCASKYFKKDQKDKQKYKEEALRYLKIAIDRYEETETKKIHPEVAMLYTRLLDEDKKYKEMKEYLATAIKQANSK